MIATAVKQDEGRGVKISPIHIMKAEHSSAT
jgi:hypothetical protein